MTCYLSCGLSVLLRSFILRLSLWLWVLFLLLWFGLFYLLSLLALCRCLLLDISEKYTVKPLTITLIIVNLILITDLPSLLAWAQTLAFGVSVKQNSVRHKKVMVCI